jgi:hypothetical protein
MYYLHTHIYNRRRLAGVQTACLYCHALLLRRTIAAVVIAAQLQELMSRAHVTENNQPRHVVTQTQ